MTAVIHLQNLSWSASAPDIRNFFSGFDIPNGGVRIIGGDDGDCFISFTNDRDAHHAIQKSGRYLNDQPISIRSSSVEEMQRVIAVAKGEATPKSRSTLKSEQPLYSASASSRKRSHSPLDRGGRPSIRSSHYEDRQSSRDSGRSGHFNKETSNHRNLRDDRERAREPERARPTTYPIDQTKQWQTNDHAQGSFNLPSARSSQITNQPIHVAVYQDVAEVNRNMGHANHSLPFAPNANTTLPSTPNINHQVNSPNQFSSDVEGRQNNSQWISNTRHRNSNNSTNIQSFPDQINVSNTTQSLNSQPAGKNFFPGGFDKADTLSEKLLLAHQLTQAQQQNVSDSSNNVKQRNIPDSHRMQGFPVKATDVHLQDNKQHFTPNRNVLLNPNVAFPDVKQSQPTQSWQEQIELHNSHLIERNVLPNPNFAFPDVTQSQPTLSWQEQIELHNTHLIERNALAYERDIQFGAAHSGNAAQDFVPPQKRLGLSDISAQNMDISPQVSATKSNYSDDYFDNPYLYSDDEDEHWDSANSNTSNNGVSVTQKMLHQHPLPPSPEKDKDLRAQFPPSQMPSFPDNACLRSSVNGLAMQHGFPRASESSNVRDSDMRSVSDDVSDSSRFGNPAIQSASIPLLPTPNGSKPQSLLDINFDKQKPIGYDSADMPRLPFNKLVSPVQPNILNPQHAISTSPQTNPVSQMDVPMEGIRNFRSNQFNHQQPTDRHQQPTDRHQQPTDRHQQPTAGHQQPTASHQQPTAGILPPTVGHQQPTVNSSQMMNTANRAQMKSPAFDYFNQAAETPPPVISISDPCALFSNLSPDVTYKHLRGLFATHDLVALNIYIRRVKTFPGDADAVVQFQSIAHTVTALNELRDSKIAGKVIKVEPCTMAKYNEYKDLYQTPVDRMRSGQLIANAPIPNAPPRIMDNRFGKSNRLSDKIMDRIVQERTSSRRRSRTPPRKIRSRSPLGSGRSRRRSPRRRSSSAKRLSISDHSRDRRPSRNEETHTKKKAGSHLVSEPAIKQTTNPSTSKAASESVNSVNHTNRFQIKESVAKVSWCAVLTGIPSKATVKDLGILLTKISYKPESLYIEVNVHKECTGTAYVELKSEMDQHVLLNSSLEIMKHTLHISSLSKEQMSSHVSTHQKAVATDKTPPGEFIIQLLGLPFDATPKTVTEFLYPAKIKDSEVSLVKTADGSSRCSGNGFAKVHSIEDRDEALKHDRGYIGKRYVTVRVASEQAKQDSIAKSGVQPALKTEPQHKPAGSDDLRTVKMVNLRYDVKPQQIEEFFGDYAPEPGSVKFIMNNGMPTGKGLIRMKTNDDAKKAVEQRNNSNFFGRTILLSVC